VHLQTNVSLWESPDFFFNFHIWTTEVILYNALNSEFANFKTPCISSKKKELRKNYISDFSKNLLLAGIIYSKKKFFYEQILHI
jgi:hypothetical protein